MKRVFPVRPTQGHPAAHFQLPLKNQRRPGNNTGQPVSESAQTSTGKVSSWLSNRKTRQNLMMFFLFLLFGIVVMNHVKSVNAQNRQDNLSTLYQARQSELKSLEEQYDQLLANNEILTQEKENSISAMLNQQGNEALLAELDKIRMLAGFKAVSGAGVTVSLNDKPGYSEINFYNEIVHDSDVRRVVDLLVNNGAAALSINGMRIVNSSYIDCYGSTIICNKDYMVPPFVISAIGPSDQLAAVVLQDSVLAQRQSFGIVVLVEKKNKLELPAFAEADNFEQYINLLEVTTP